MNKHELWLDSYIATADKLISKIEACVLKLLERVVVQLSFLGSISSDVQTRSNLRTASRCAGGMSLRLRQLKLKIKEDLSQLKPLAQAIINHSKNLDQNEANEEEVASEHPLLDKLALAFLDRANCFGPTRDLQDFFLEDASPEIEIHPAMARAQSIIEGLGLFDVQGIELLFNPIEGPAATLPLLYNSLLSALEGSRISFSAIHD